MITALNTQITNILSGIDVDELSRDEQKIVSSLKHLLVDTRLDIRDYEFAETKAEQTKLARVAVRNINKVRGLIVAASEHDIFSAIDVAQLTSQLDLIAEKL